MKVPLCDFVKNMSQAPFKAQMLIQLDIRDYFTNPSKELKKYFGLGFL